MAVTVSTMNETIVITCFSLRSNFKFWMWFELPPISLILFFQYPERHYLFCIRFAVILKFHYLHKRICVIFNRHLNEVDDVKSLEIGFRWQSSSVSTAFESRLLLSLQKLEPNYWNQAEKKSIGCIYQKTCNFLVNSMGIACLILKFLVYCLFDTHNGIDANSFDIEII